MTVDESIRLAKLIQELAMSLEKVGGNSSLILKDITEIKLIDILQTMSKNGIGFKITKEHKIDLKEIGCSN